jgi:hypothetical protein
MAAPVRSQLPLLPAVSQVWSALQSSPVPEQSTGAPSHAPLPQMSPVVQGLPSSQAAVLSVLVQAVDTQSSSVQGLPSSQSPALLQGHVLTWLHPTPVTQLSVVQASLSSQGSMAPPTQMPPAQASFVVQGRPSSQGSVFGVPTHPSTGSQESSVQSFPSSHVAGGPPLQAPALQVSAVVQGSPSLQEPVLLP